MFTGIIEQAGTVVEVSPGSGGTRLALEALGFDGALRIGDSVAVNGVCLTAVECRDGRLEFDVVNETLSRSNLASLRVGDRVNLERPMRADGRFDGHIVQGHVDATAALECAVSEGQSHRLRFELPPDVLRYIVEKGSITVDGISLTVARLGDNWFEVVIIPHTWEFTNLASRRPGDRVNIEVDVLAKYVERLLIPRG